MVGCDYNDLGNRTGAWINGTCVVGQTFDRLAICSIRSQHTLTVTTGYLYGHERLAAWYGSDSIWYAADALGFVRLTLDDGGSVLGGTMLDIGSTSEMQDSSRMVYLRARWYNPQQGRFASLAATEGPPYWFSSSLVLWFPGSLVPWFPGSLVPWFFVLSSL